MVQFGTDGYMEPPVRVDIGRGTRVTGEGNYCTVIVGMDRPAPGIMSATYTIGARLGFFAAPSIAPPMLTTFIDGLANGTASDPIDVPVRANYILPPVQTDVAGSMRIDFLDSFGVVRYSRAILAATPPAAPIPVTADIRQIVVNNTGGAPADFRIPWQISA
jgi:hypothetical protein